MPAPPCLDWEVKCLLLFATDPHHFHLPRKSATFTQNRTSINTSGVTDQDHETHIVLYLYIYIAPLAEHTNQKHFHLHTSAAQMKWYLRATVCEELATGAYTATISDEAQTRTLHVTG